MLNPYNFSSPVRDINLLFGRSNELVNINYYLEQGNLTGNPISIALIGDRASGKTSIINATEEISKKLSYVPVRIDLNESDVQGDDRFFYKLFDALVFEACMLGAFGGISGKFYAEYLTLIAGGDTEGKFCPLYFPRIYGKISTNSPGSYINDNVIVRDFNLIRNEIGKNIIFLIDEANLISTNLSILQKLRNIIMKIMGYSILIAGTDSIFPSIDEVFSPIARQFVKIQIGPFNSTADTADCILKPLEMNEETNKIHISESTIQEIHKMTYGKPYEIQFVCHTLFKRASENSSLEMKINSESMSNIMRQLVDLSARSDSDFIRFSGSLSNDELKVLRIIESYASGVSPELLRNHMRVFFNYRDAQIDSLQKIIQRLLDNSVIKYENDKIQFAGDAFEAIYLKYIGRHKSDYSAPDTSSNIWKARVFSLLLHGIASSFNRFSVSPSIDFFQEFQRITKLVNSSKATDLSAQFELEILKEMYEATFFYFKGGHSPTFINTKISISGLDVNLVFINLHGSPRVMNDINRRLETLKQKIIAVGGRLTFSAQAMPLPSRNNIVKAVIDIDDTALISEISQIHEQNIYNMYIDKGDVLAKPIEIHIEALMSYVNKLDRDYNNLGYVLTYNKRFKEAIPVLLSTLESVNESDYFRRAMVHYNLAIAQYASGNMEESLKNSEDALRYSEHLAKVRRECGCLLFINDAGKIEESRLSPDLYEFSRNLINLVNTSRELEQDTQPAAEKPTN